MARLQTAAKALNLTELPRRTASQPPPPVTGGSSFTSRSVSPQILDFDPMNRDGSRARRQPLPINAKEPVAACQ